MKKNILVALCCIIILYGCSNAQDKKSVHIFIPMNYTGWVNIISNDTSSSIEPLTFNNGYVYLINKNPEAFKIKSSIFPFGKYEMNFYYYNTDTCVKLSWLSYPKRNIFFQRDIEKTVSNKKGASLLQAFSFYVSKDPLNIDGLSVDNLPKNKILE